MTQTGRAVKALVVVYSYHHHNTEKVARAIAEVWGAEVKAPRDIKPGELAQYELVAFGSGIYGGLMHKELIALAQAAPATARGKAVIFSTAGMPVGADKRDEKVREWHAPLRRVLEGVGYKVLGEFNCPGWLNMSILKLFGGLNRGRPNEQDLKQAADLAREVWLKAQSYREPEW